MEYAIDSRFSLRHFIVVFTLVAVFSMEKSINSFDIIKNEKINYNCRITVKSHILTEVYHYSREFETYIDYKILTVKLNIPYTGGDKKFQRSRILLYLDDEPICDGSIFCGTHDMDLRPIYLEGISQNVKAGKHKIKLMCSVDDGTLHIPAFDIKYIENTIKPEIFGTMIIIGQN